ncbi:MAG: adenylate/guanylate cyclase domain-containing protein, partial [Rubrivivax sp.]|nr:adenylate/guanylate cyclase domain-containing protein [Rubrivivax sp.]
MAFPDRAVASDDNPSAPAAGAAPARHRLSVLFCDLCDSTALSGSLEAEDYAALLSALRRIYDEAVTRHGGTVVRILGDGLLAVFGYPVPSEGDGRRAVLAALQMHEAVKHIAPLPGALGAHGRPGEGPQGLRLHSGIHAGLVLVQGGDHVVGRLELMGMVPNIAARLSAEAGPDELLVSDETLGPARALFRTDAARRVRVQGHEQAIDCWTVAARADAPAPAAAPRGRAARPAGVGRAAGRHRRETGRGEARAGA